MPDDAVQANNRRRKSGRARAAKARLATDFNWASIASGTAEVYASAVVREPRVLGRPKIATGNLFT